MLEPCSRLPASITAMVSMKARRARSMPSGGIRGDVEADDEVGDGVAQLPAGLGCLRLRFRLGVRLDLLPGLLPGLLRQRGSAREAERAGSAEQQPPVDLWLRCHLILPRRRRRCGPLPAKSDARAKRAGASPGR
jgi:hypothetical protein